MRFTCPYTSQQNGRAERKHRHVVEMCLTLLAQAKMPLMYWSEAFQTSAYPINRLPTPVLGGKTPLFCLLRKKPDYSLIQPFGCACFPCLKPYNNQKFQFHSQKCVYLGPAPQHKGFKWLSSSGRIYVSSHVVFDPSIFPFVPGFIDRSPASDSTNYLIGCDMMRDLTLIPMEKSLSPASLSQSITNPPSPASVQLADVHRSWPVSVHSSPLMLVNSQNPNVSPGVDN